MFFTARVSFILVIQLGLLRAFPEPLESFPTLIIAAAVSSQPTHSQNHIPDKRIANFEPKLRTSWSGS